MGPPGAGAATPGASEIAVHIDPSSTRVGMARVRLDVTETTLRGTELHGRYRIRVPLFPFKNDAGTIRLHSESLIDPGNDTHGTLVGTAHSDSGAAREVICTLGSDNSIDIKITMDTSIVTFKTKYRRL